jgi:putative SOS response-associated peptidase YedK
MCGRYVLIADPAAIQQEFSLSSLPEIAPRYNIAPRQTLPVITNEQPDEITFLQWGLITSWSKDESIASKMINARAETVDSKPAFRAAFRRRRCIVPASGFYEWQARETGKAPMFIHLNDRDVFGIAGLWEVWRSPEGEEQRTYTILTTDANTFMTPIHNRMPVILRREDYSLWLAPGEVPADDLKPLLEPYSAAAMAAYEVSKAVNRVTVDESKLIEPVAS